MSLIEHLRALALGGALLLVACGAPTPTPIFSPSPILPKPQETIQPTRTPQPTSTPPPTPTAVPDPHQDWPQLGHDPQRTNYSTVQVNPPFCYAWKWYAVPIASRVQPVVFKGLLYVGAMDGTLYARDASTGAPVWSYMTRAPIRHSPAVINEIVVVSSYDGFTYALDAKTGALIWKTMTGPSETAPLADEESNRVFVASASGELTALDARDGSILWRYDSGSPILTSPALGEDGAIVFFGNEDISAIAVRSSDGSKIWQSHIKGQSLADRYPVVMGNSVMYVSEPVYSFSYLLREGDAVLDRAGPVDPDWAKDWAKVKPQILNYLKDAPDKQTFFVLDAKTGKSKGTAPILYNFGMQDNGAPPVVYADKAFVRYRGRHGIQQDGHSIHVSSKYDSDPGIFNPNTLDVTPLRSSDAFSGSPQFRMTSDEPAVLTMGGDTLWVDNWERLGGINVKTGALITVGSVSNDWQEPTGPRPFFPLAGTGMQYPFPSPQLTEGRARGGAVIANHMLYWHVWGAGLAGIAHRDGDSCPELKLWQDSAPTEDPKPPIVATNSARALTDYITFDATTPNPKPDSKLVTRLRGEVNALVSANGHLLPFYLERGFSNSSLFPAEAVDTNLPPAVTFQNTGNTYWYDPGELLYSLALAYPYLDIALQSKVTDYVGKELARYPLLKNLPFDKSWLTDGVAREPYAVPFRKDLNVFPAPATSLSSLYSLWLWSKNTGDWSYAKKHWDEARSLFALRSGEANSYSDLAGMIGYVRLAQALNKKEDVQASTQKTISALNSGKDFDAFATRARNLYPNAVKNPAGYFAPVFFGLTPEIGLFLREMVGANAMQYLLSLESGEGLRWWYLTRAGEHAETSESSFIPPEAAWAHFLAHAYLIGDSQATLDKWLDRPWATGDLYSIQKIVATIQAPP